MANPLKIFIEALLGKKTKEMNYDEIKQAESMGEMALRKVAKRVGIVEQVDIDAEKARQDAFSKKENRFIEKTEERI